MDDYLASALRQAALFIAIMVGASFIYFASSKNEKIHQRLLVSAYPLIFLLGELFALIGSTYYERGSWINGDYVRTEVGKILVLSLDLIFILGILMSIYTLVIFKGTKITKYLAIPVYLAAFILWFISAMTLTRDWL